MSKYFAKYLPVEGEIRTGDVYFTKGDVVETRRAKIPETYNNPHVPYYDGYKKAKLFLCTYDFKPGDKCYHYKYLHLGEFPVEKQTIVDCVEWNGENVDISKLFKAIGEISPEADWVKQGDEFEEIQIELRYHKEGMSKSIPEKFFKKLQIYSDVTGYKCIVRIKCPCCKTYK